MKVPTPQIEYYRKLAHFSKHDLAELLDVSVATVSNYESGRTAPSMETIMRMAHALGVTCDQLLGYRIPRK
ncbi:MAG: helix-turn-helix transcriptional regulator [Clostridia bacterium]|nr:helix-turn-helix transcriptional regulator [Clostridia bacterium]